MVLQTLFLSLLLCTLRIIFTSAKLNNIHPKMYSYLISGPSTHIFVNDMILLGKLNSYIILSYAFLKPTKTCHMYDCTYTYFP